METITSLPRSSQLKTPDSIKLWQAGVINRLDLTTPAPGPKGKFLQGYRRASVSLEIIRNVHKSLLLLDCISEEKTENRIDRRKLDEIIRRMASFCEMTPLSQNILSSPEMSASLARSKL